MEGIGEGEKEWRGLGKVRRRRSGGDWGRSGGDWGR